MPETPLSSAAAETSATEPERTTEERQESLLRLAIRSLRIGKQNLQDTQLSCDARAIGFFEGIALTLRKPENAAKAGAAASTEEYPEDDPLLHFRVAASLCQEPISDRDTEGEKAHKLLGLEAMCNVSTLQQQRVIRDRELKDGWMLSEIEYEGVSEAVRGYEEVLSRTAGCPEPDKIRIDLNVRLGLLVCTFAVWSSARSKEVPTKEQKAEYARLAAANLLSILDTAEQHLKLTESTTKKEPFGGLFPNLSKWFRTVEGHRNTAGWQIVRQVRVFHDKVAAVLPPPPPDPPAAA
ncbi:hypothetical protein HDF16_006290 [Granulicella aggregans]|uniref:Uncharacterized protein n=1 Tax=Granulicella aggregans TaxID=474949 RepID=A0A7W7ZKD9_9BACT|nr:hypothetical protein [Granulicella aggregans]MBB5061554.1 hypothetical protein [Granulicella aggregans]